MIRRVRFTIAMTAVAAVLATGFSAAAFAQGPGPRRGGGFGHARPGGPGLPLQALDLSEAQREQVRGVMQSHREELRTAAQRLREAHAAQRQAVEAVPVNEGLIRSTSGALADAQTQMALVQARVHNAVWAILTPEQQAEAKELKAKRAARAKERQQRRRPQQQG